MQWQYNSTNKHVKDNCFAYDQTHAQITLSSVLMGCQVKSNPEQL